MTTVEHNVQAAVTTTILHAAEDSKTLVRTIMQLSANHVGVVEQPLGIMLEHQPNGVQVYGLSTTEVLDDPKGREFMFQENKVCSVEGDTLEFFIDSSGMRKLSTGDRIVLKDKTSLNDAYTLNGVITLFFKE